MFWGFTAIFFKAFDILTCLVKLQEGFVILLFQITFEYCKLSLHLRKKKSISRDKYFTEDPLGPAHL